MTPQIFCSLKPSNYDLIGGAIIDSSFFIIAAREISMRQAMRKRSLKQGLPKSEHIGGLASELRMFEAANVEAKLVV